jgi:hypothetical protein
MLKINRFTLSTVLLIFILCINLVYAQIAFADDSTPPAEEPAAAEETAAEEPAVDETATEEPIVDGTEAAPSSDEAGSIEEEEEPAETEIAALLEEVPENSTVVVLNEEGEAVPLASQEAAEIVQIADPIWCPESAVPPITAGTQGCTTAYTSINLLLENMNEDVDVWSADYAQNGVIYLDATPITSAVTITDDAYANLFSNFSIYNLTLQGGWDTSTGTLSGQTVFNGPNAFLQIGTSDNPWSGSVTLNNITIFDSQAANASLEVYSSGEVTLTDVVVLGSGTGQDGISISASDANLTNVRAEWADKHGISITATEEGGTVTLNNVVAKNNKESGVFIDGSNTLIHVFGGSFVNNSRFGIEAQNSTSTSIPLANAWTNQDDYSPGSVVTLSGNNNSLNGSMLGYIPGETVQVNVWGPNGYTATCEGIAGELGEWECQITLWDSELAVGDYFYICHWADFGHFRNGRVYRCSHSGHDYN